MDDRICDAIAATDGAAEVAPRMSATTYRFGDMTVCFRAFGHGHTGMLFRSIRHRQVETARHCATIDILGGPQPRLAPLLPPEDQRHLRFKHEGTDSFLFWAAEGNLTLLDRRTGRGIVWFVNSDNIPSWVMGRPFLPLIKALSAASTWTPAHAAAVASDSGGILILGSSNAGKSSTALACVEAGWRFVGDDCVLLKADPPHAANLYATARIRSDMFASFPSIMAAVDRISFDSGDPRAEIDVASYRSADIGDAGLKAIVLPRRTGSDRPMVAPMSRNLALRALSVTSLVMMPGTYADAHRAYADIVASVPCYTVDFGPDIQAIPSALADIIRECRS